MVEDEQWLCLETTICQRAVVHGRWAWMKTGERGEAWQERRREWEALVTLLIFSASSTGPLLPLLSNFLLPPMPPRSYRKLWFEMLPIAPAEISFAVQCREWRWRASTSLRLPGWRMARWSPWRSSRARWSSWRTPPPCEGRPPGTSCRWMNCARRWDAAIFDFIPLSLSLSLQFPGSLAVLGFPCNQFGDQENCENGEILNALEHVRPGRGFVPLATIFQKVNVSIWAQLWILI